MKPCGEENNNNVIADIRVTPGRIALFAAAFVLTWISGMILGIDRYFLSSRLIAPGVHVVQVSIGGLDMDSARQSLVNNLPSPSVVRMVAEGSDKVLNLPSKDVGLALDVDRALEDAYVVGRQGRIFQRVSDRRAAKVEGRNLPIHASYNEGALKYVFTNTARKRFETLAKNATMEIRDGQFLRTPEQEGLEIDIEQSLAQAYAFDITEPADLVHLPLVLVRSIPEITLSDLTPITTELTRYVTNYNTYERARTHNLTLAANATDGVLIKPGDVFSYNESVGPRLAKLGYKEAPIFVNGQIVDGLGGGICQVSSTLYNAALLSGMKISQRSHHSMAVRYVPPGLDATVAYGILDFKFKNPLKNAIYIRTKVNGGRLTTIVYGAAEDKKNIRIVRNVSSTVPHGRRTIVDNNLPPGASRVVEKGVMGYTVSVQRVIEQDGEKVTENISTDRYRPHDSVIQVGPSQQPTQTAQEKMESG